MAEKEVCGGSLEGIPDNISVGFLPNCEKITSKVLTKALNYYQQGYIHDISVSDGHVSAKCWASMRKSQAPHRLTLDIDKENQRIADAHCTCMAGLSGHCSHVVGLIKTLQCLKLNNFKEVPELQSCTSMPVVWGKPRGSKIRPTPISSVVVAKPVEQRKRKPLICNTNVNLRLPKIVRLDLLSALKGTPLETRISSSVPMVSTPIGDVQVGSVLSYQTREITMDEPTPVVQQQCGILNGTTEHVTLPEDLSELKKKQHCDDPRRLEEQTKDQSRSDVWFAERRKRLTSSNFGKVLNRKKHVTDAFLKNLFQSNTKDVHAASLDHGKRNEKPAKEAYLEKYPARHLHECGLIINNEFPFLGASPDGKVCHNGQTGIMEVKCPFQARNMTITQACEEIRGFCMEQIEGADSATLKKNHEYYGQIQGQLMISKFDFCDFVVFTHNGIHVERITPDIPFMKVMLVKLSEFYRDHALPFIQGQTE